MPKKEGNFRLKKKLRTAGIYESPKHYTDKVMRSSVMVGIVMGVFSFFLISKSGLPLILVPAAGLVFFLMTYFTLFKAVDASIAKRAKEIDKDVVFAGRFLLIKLNSGKPLVSSIIEASQSYGVASHYFKEIVRNIELGTSIEDALNDAMEYCPSHKMKRVLFQINSALKAGVDATQNLEAVLDEITHDQMIEIQKYGKKLSGLTLFYMLGAVVLPSLGMTMFIVVASLVSLSIPPTLFMSILFFLILIELVFVSMFRSIRPSVNL
ncbi:type II secretion system F family protein [Candidatus Woesearchaeota archaeon]|nr:type II secretion system F family protein [Candidatus Woesearchaeota archaeon]